MFGVWKPRVFHHGYFLPDVIVSGDGQSRLGLRTSFGGGCAYCGWNSDPTIFQVLLLTISPFLQWQCIIICTMHYIMPKYDTEIFVCANIMDIMAYSYAFSSPPWSACKSSVSPPSKPIGDHLLLSYCSIALDIDFLLLATILTSLSNAGRGALASLNISNWSALSLLIHIFKILHKRNKTELLTGWYLGGLWVSK